MVWINPYGTANPYGKDFKRYGHRAAIVQAAMALPTVCHGTANGLPWHCHRVAIAQTAMVRSFKALPTVCHGTAIELPIHCHRALWYCQRSDMAQPTNHHGNFIKLPILCHRATKALL